MHILGVAMATEALECAVLLSTGETVLFGLGLQHRTQDILDNEIADITDSRDRGDVFSPRFILGSLNGGVDKVCLSDIGMFIVSDDKSHQFNRSIVQGSWQWLSSMAYSWL